MGMRINHLVMIFYDRRTAGVVFRNNSRRLFCGDSGVRLYLRICLKVNNCKSSNVGFFLLFIYLVYYLHVNKCYAEGKMGICLGLIYNVIDLRK